MTAFARCVFVSPTTGLKVRLATALDYWSYQAADMGQPESLAGAREAHIAAGMLVEQPADLEVQRTYLVSFMALTLANSRNGRVTKTSAWARRPWPSPPKR